MNCITKLVALFFILTSLSFGEISYINKKKSYKIRNSHLPRRIIHEDFIDHEKKIYFDMFSKEIYKHALRGIGNMENSKDWSPFSRERSIMLAIRSKAATRGLTSKEPKFWKEMGKIVFEEKAPISCDQGVALTIYELDQFLKIYPKTLGPIEIIFSGDSLTQNGHWFLVIGRDPNTNINSDLNKWGENAYIIDLWAAIQKIEQAIIIPASMATGELIVNKKKYPRKVWLKFENSDFTII